MPKSAKLSKDFATLHPGEGSVAGVGDGFRESARRRSSGGSNSGVVVAVDLAAIVAGVHGAKDDVPSARVRISGES
jgi:hypothetical protein